MVGRLSRDVCRLVATDKRSTSPDCWNDSKSVKLPKRIIYLIADAQEVLNSLIYLPQVMAYAAKVSQRLTKLQLSKIGGFRKCMKCPGRGDFYRGRGKSKSTRIGR